MKPNMTREMLEQELIKPTLKLKRKRVVREEIKKFLFNHHAILEGNTQRLITDPREELPKVSWEVLYLFAEQVYSESTDEKVNPLNYFTENEQKIARTFKGNIVKEGDIKLPITFNNFIEINFNEYLGKMNMKQISDLTASLLQYNFDVQREPMWVTENGVTRPEPRTYQRNINAINKNLQEGKQKTTQIVINASLDTADEGEELTYNPETLQLTVNAGTVLDILDGYHRCKGIQLAHNLNPKVDKEFAVLIVNTTVDEAQQYQGQLAEATPITRTRMEQLKSERKADEVVAILKANSDLGKHISDAHTVNLSAKQVVSYKTLVDQIDKDFKMEYKRDASIVGKYLTDFFDMLAGSYPKEFMEQPAETRKISVINENTMFAGYIRLAKRMYENKIDVMNIMDYMSKIDFNRDNPLWKEIGYLQQNGTLGNTDKARKNIVEYFNNFDL